MSEELKITKEKVLEAAKCCPQSKATLEKLFPEVFECGDFIIPFNFEDSYGSIVSFKQSKTEFCRRNECGSEFNWKSVFLGRNYDWRILKDKMDSMCLVCFQKGKAPRRSDV